MLAHIALLLLQVPSVIVIQVPSYEPAPCFSEDQKERLTRAANLAARLPQYVVLVEKQARKLEEFLRSGTTVSGDPWGPEIGPSFYEAVRGTICVAGAVRQDILGEKVDHDSVDKFELHCLADGMKKLQVLLESALKEEWFFDHQRGSLQRALWETEEAEAAVEQRFPKPQPAPTHHSFF